MMSYVEFESIEVGEFAADISVECDVIAVDHGIGHYEFWGSKGYQSDIRLETDGDLKLTVDSVWDEECNDVALTPEVMGLITKWMFNNESEIKEKLIRNAEENIW